MSNRYVHSDPILASILSKPKDRKDEEEIDVKTIDKKKDGSFQSVPETIDISRTANASDTTNTPTDSIINSNEDKDESRQPLSESKWRKVKTVIKNSTEAKNRNSMTAQESLFLSMRKRYQQKKKKENENSSSNNLPSDGSIKSFSSIVSAAIARARLRQDLSIRLSKLSMKEAEFLKDIVNDDNSTQQELENADYVLNTDPLYRLPGEDSNMESMKSIEEFVVPKDGRLSDVLQGHRVHIDGRDIEILLDWEDYGAIPPESMRMSKLCKTNKFNDLDAILTMPSEFSYSTWEYKEDKSMSLVGLPEEFKAVDQVLSPPMMKSLRKSLPFAVSEDFFWLKYAMTRDGASLQGLYDTVRQSTRTLIAIETVNGEVFGAFISSPWRSYPSFYGSCEAFLWRMKQSRFTPTLSVEEQIELEKDIEVYKWSQENRNIQMSDPTKLVIGGGYPDNDDDDSESNEWGFGIALGSDLFEGTSSHCVTFKSPTLSKSSPKGEVFEVSNMEVWTFTPCNNLKDADQLEMGRMFVLSHFQQA